MDTTEVMSIREAAHKLGVSRQRVEALIRQNILPFQVVGEKRMVPLAAVKSRLAQQNGGKRKWQP
jgi:excisionase family DNA binding protein